MSTNKPRVLIETMPADLVESHKAAGNFGTYPANGSERRVVDATEADSYLADNGYDRIVRDATDEDEERYG